MTTSTKRNIFNATVILVTVYGTLSFFNGGSIISVDGNNIGGDANVGERGRVVVNLSNVGSELEKTLVKYQEDVKNIQREIAVSRTVTDNAIANLSKHTEESMQNIVKIIKKLSEHIKVLDRDNQRITLANQVFLHPIIGVCPDGYTLAAMSSSSDNPMKNDDIPKEVHKVIRYCLKKEDEPRRKE